MIHRHRPREASVLKGQRTHDAVQRGERQARLDLAPEHRQGTRLGVSDPGTSATGMTLAVHMSLEIISCGPNVTLARPAARMRTPHRT